MLSLLDAVADGLNVERLQADQVNDLKSSEAISQQYVRRRHFKRSIAGCRTSDTYLHSIPKQGKEASAKMATWTAPTFPPHRQATNVCIDGFCLFLTLR